jgi:hypothetical protein
MLLRVHKKLSFSLSSCIKRNIEVYDCTGGEKKQASDRRVQFYEHLDESFCCCSPFHRDMYSIGVRSTIISRNKNQKQKIAYTKLLLLRARRRKKET